MNSSFYKNFIKKYEYTIDLGVIKYRSNLHFRTKDVSLWTPIGSFNHSTYQNRMTGKTRVSADMSLGLDAKAVEGTASFGFSYARDRNGNVHPRDVDFRAGLEASAGIWPLTGTAGISASLVRGTRVYGGVEASAGYIDNVKEEIFGGIGELIPLKSPSLELWSGEYSVTESN
jgi:hypothetical protein